MAMSARMTEPRLRARLADGTFTGVWRLDAARSTVRLSSRGMWGLVPVKGVFGDVSGEGVVSADGRARGRITVAAASIDTRNQQRDEHLRSADFLHSDVHQDIVFTVERLTPGADGVMVAGTLRVHGRTRPMSFGVTVTAESEDEVRLDAEVRIDRFDFGMTWNRMGMAARISTVIVSAVFRRD